MAPRDGEPQAGTRTARQRAGDAAEALIARRLAASGWAILGRQVRVGRGELDIVALDPGPPRELVVIEVRWRSSRSFGLPEETVDRRKRRHLREAVARLFETGRLPDGHLLPRLPARIDLVVVEPGRTADQPYRVRHHRSPWTA